MTSQGSNWRHQRVAMTQTVSRWAEVVRWRRIVANGQISAHFQRLQKKSTWHRTRHQNPVSTNDFLLYTCIFVQHFADFLQILWHFWSVNCELFPDHYSPHSCNVSTGFRYLQAEKDCEEQGQAEACQQCLLLLRRQPTQVVEDLRPCTHVLVYSLCFNI